MKDQAFAEIPNPGAPYPPNEADKIPRPVSLRAIDLEPYECSTPHSHAEVGQLAWVRKGSLRISTPGKLWFVLPSQALWIPPGVYHCVEAGASKVEMRNVYARVDAFENLPDQLCILPVDALLDALINRASSLPRLYPYHSSQERLILTLMDQIIAYPKSASPIKANASAACPDDLMALPMPKEQRLYRVCRTLLDNPADGRTLADWANLAGASERTLSRLFHQETGMAFGNWLRHMRTVHACHRLSAGDPISTIAFDLGYASQSAFITMFRRKTGLTPARFRGMIKARPNVDAPHLF